MSEPESTKINANKKLDSNFTPLPAFDQGAIHDPAWFFASLVDNLPVNVVCKDAAGRFTYVNQAFAELMKMPAEDFVGKTDFDISPGQLAYKYRADDRRVMESGETFREVEEVVQPLGKSKSYFEVRKSPLRGRDGTVLGIEAVFWDVTAQVEAELAAQHERFLLSSLMDNIPDSIYFKDINSRFIRVSEGQAVKFGLHAPEDVLGKTDADIFSAEHADAARDDELKIMRTGNPILNKVEKETWPEGLVTWCSTTKMPLLDRDGDAVGTFGISRDITELVLTEEALRKAMLAADAASRAKSEFLANMSHEIRTPMNAVLGITELLLNTELTNSQREYLNLVLSSGESLLSLINDILDFSKIEAGKFELLPSRFDLRDNLGDTARVLSMRAHAKNLELAFSVDPDVPNFLCGDINRLRQVVVNLVGNAIKFTEKGEIVLNISCQSIDAENVTLVFRVSDTGIGIPHEKTDLIFREFEQGDATTTRVYGGSGLGLAICTRLVELMAGKIWVESEVGTGSTFAFTAEFQISPESDSDAKKSKPIMLPGTRVLIVDDSKTNRLILNSMLLTWGMDPVTATSAKEALAILNESENQGELIPLVLTDIDLPATDGFGFAKSVRMEKRLSDVVIILLTSGMRDVDMQKSHELGVKYHLTKPLKQSEVFETIVAALGTDLIEKDVVPQRVGANSEMTEQLKILLVEDNIVNQKLAIGVLLPQGHKITVANNGREAVEKWKAETFDLVLMDVQMPVMDGFQATREIRKLEIVSGRHTPIIAMTARAMEQDRHHCLEAGMDDYLSKPIRIKELSARIFSFGTGGSPDSFSQNISKSRRSTKRQIDWEIAKSNVNGDTKLLMALIRTLQNNAPRLIKQIVNAVAESDSAALKLNAHTLKGSVLFLGDVSLSLPAAKLEAIGRDGEIGTAKTTLKDLKSKWKQLGTELDDYVNSISPG